MNNSNLNDICSACRHIFGIHYETYSGNKTGCSQYNNDQRENYGCECKGFVIAFRRAPDPVQSGYAKDNSGFWVKTEGFPY